MRNTVDISCRTNSHLALSWNVLPNFAESAHMADTLDIRMCAQGIENQDQFEFFEEIGAFKGQGPLISNLMPLDELEEYAGHYALGVDHE